MSRRVGDAEEVSSQLMSPGRLKDSSNVRILTRIPNTAPRPSNWSFKRRRIYIIGGGLILICLIAALIYIFVSSSSKVDKEAAVVKNFPEVVPVPPSAPVLPDAKLLRSAFALNDSLDTSYNPCTNFYGFACSHWIKSNPLSSGQSYYKKWTQFIKLDWAIKQDIKKLLKAEVDGSDSVPLADAKAYYAKCISDDGLNHTALVSEVELDIFVNALLYPIEGQLGELSRNGFKHLVEISILQNNSTSYAIQLSKSKIMEVMALLYEDYATWFNETQSLQLAFQSKHTTDFANDAILQLPYDRLIAILDWDNKGIFGNITLFKWDKYLRHVFQVRFYDDFFDHVPFVLSIDDLFFLRAFTFTFGIQSEYVQRLLLRKIVLINLLVDSPFEQSLEKGLVGDLRINDEGYEQLHSISLFGQDNVTKLEEKCALHVNSLYGMAISYKYIQTHFSLATREKAMQMFENVRDSFHSRINNVDWIATLSTRLKALEKLNAIESIVGYPDFITNSVKIEEYYEGLSTTPKNENDTFTEISLRVIGQRFEKKLKALRKTVKSNKLQRIERWVTTPTEVNAYYSQSQNRIYLPAGILRQPFFGHSLEAMNYGSLGTIIGHEITHAFDSTGRLVDKNGDEVDWFDSSSSNAFTSKSKCFQAQYEKFNYHGVENKTNGVKTLGENIADSGGIRQSYHAYQQYVKVHGKEASLPGIPYTANQLFFIAAAQSFCSSESSETIQRQINNDVHTPSQARVLGMMRNTREFYSAWNCPLPRDKEICQIW